MSLIPVNSSNLAAVGYNPYAAVLTIAFHGDRVYRYFHVPHKVFAGLMKASSHGKFFHAHIKNHYGYQRIA
jgi:hypothetical protein